MKNILSSNLLFGLAAATFLAVPALAQEAAPAAAEAPAAAPVAEAPAAAPAETQAAPAPAQEAAPAEAPAQEAKAAEEPKAGTSPFCLIRRTSPMPTRSSMKPYNNHVTTYTLLQASDNGCRSVCAGSHFFM